MHIDPNTLIIWLLVGAIAGWLAGQVMRGGGFGLVGDIIVGIIGAFIAGELFPRLGVNRRGAACCARTPPDCRSCRELSERRHQP